MSRELQRARPASSIQLAGPFLGPNGHFNLRIKVNFSVHILFIALSVHVMYIVHKEPETVKKTWKTKCWEFYKRIFNYMAYLNIKLVPRYSYVQGFFSQFFHFFLIFYIFYYYLSLLPAVCFNTFFLVFTVSTTYFNLCLYVQIIMCMVPLIKLKKLFCVNSKYMTKICIFFGFP